MIKFDALKFLIKILSIDSQTRNSHGVNEVQDSIEEVLKSFGYDIQRFAHPEGKSGDLLTAALVKNPSFPWINFIGHADTVLPTFPVQMGKKIWRGSGIADNKGGVVTLLQTLYSLKDKGLPFNYRIVISPNEEAGSPGFHDHFKEWGKTSFLNLGFEPALENDELIESRNGNRWYELKLSTLAGHAGRAPKGRVNLVHRVSELLMNLESTFCYDVNTKFNVTSIQTSNQKFNVITDEIILRIDARFNSFEGRNKFHHEFLGQMKRAERPCERTNINVNSSYTIADDCPPMSLVNVDFLSTIDLPSAHSGGAADINYFSTPENYSLDGWGGRGGNLHSKEEWLDVESMFERAKILTHWIDDLAKKYQQETSTSLVDIPCCT